MKFDTLIIARCNNASAANQPTICNVNRDSTKPGGVDTSNDTDPTDDPPDGDDDHFPPDDTTERLILKPEVASLSIGGTLQFKTFLVGITGEEAELTSGLAYSSSSPAIAAVSTDGYATALAQGITGISVTWQGLNASAQLQVIATCADTAVGMLLLLDVSKSMSQPLYAPYTSRLNFSKLLARRFAGEVNETKDLVGYATFDAALSLQEALTDDKEAVQAAILQGSFTQNKTDLKVALTAAVALLDADTTISKRVIVLFSDGENNTGEDPVPVAQAFKESGGVIVVVGCRAGGKAFRCLEKIASAGLFMNAIATNYAAIGDLLSASKSYYCAGNCAPAGDGCFPSPELNINVAPNTGLTNWDVTGAIDLIGRYGDDAWYDLLPGHGMYVDLVGSSAPWAGKITSKTAFTLEAGVQYTLRFKLAGNQRSPSKGYLPMFPDAGSYFTTRVVMGTLLDMEYEVAWKDGFTVYEEFLAGDGAAHYLSFEQTNYTGSYGNLLDDIELVRDDTGEVIFRETFDDENITCAPPACGTGDYGTGYACYGVGCMDEPIGEQTEDVNPPADIEGGNTGTVYTSTENFMATCPAGTTGAAVIRTATATSTISQADADAKAIAEARRQAESALVCAGSFAVGDILNLHINNGSTASAKQGFGAIGNAATDYWNSIPFERSAPKVADGELLVGTIDQSSNASAFTTAHPDQMFKVGSKFASQYAPEQAGTLGYIDIMPTQAGTYDLYLYGHGTEDAENTAFLLHTGTKAAVGVSLEDVTVIGEKATGAAGGQNAAGFVEGVHYVRFAAVALSSNTERFRVYVKASGENAHGWVQGIQLKRVS